MRWYESLGIMNSSNSFCWGQIWIPLYPVFKFKFVVYNPCQSYSALTIYGLWFIIISSVFLYLSKLLFSVFFKLKLPLLGESNSKYSDKAALKSFEYHYFFDFSLQAPVRLSLKPRSRYLKPLPDPLHYSRSSLVSLATTSEVWRWRKGAKEVITNNVKVCR